MERKLGEKLNIFLKKQNQKGDVRTHRPCVLGPGLKGALAEPLPAADRLQPGGHPLGDHLGHRKNLRHARKYEVAWSGDHQRCMKISFPLCRWSVPGLAN